MASDWIRGDKIHKTVILDSSAILMFFEVSVDWKKELDRLVGSYRLMVPTTVARELEILSTHRKDQKKAAAALKLIETFERIDDPASSADEALVNIALKTHGIVVTNDSELRKRLKNNGLSVIFLRGRKKLVLDE
ncbi:MAG TPA: DNA-binding protein [Thermoplasmatales archaeon]|nr:DNA-binding protein [Thermoplasmatales archaeon]